MAAFPRRVLAVTVAAGLIAAWLAAPPIGAQSAADYQALKRELETLRQRTDALEKELAALKGQPRQTATPAPAAAIGAPADIPLNLDRAPVRGTPTAPVMLVEIGDFQCPFCGRFFQQTQPQVMRDYLNTGKIRYAFVNLPLTSHNFAFKAAEAAECARDQGKYWEMHNLLFSRQPALAVPQLTQYAQQLGLKTQPFQTCLDTSRHAPEVTSDATQAQRLGVTGTPTFFVGSYDAATKTLKGARKIVGSKPYATFKEALDSALGGVAPKS